MTDRRISKFQPRVETLEDRCVLSTASLQGGVLTILGTNAADTIVVREMNNTQIRIDGIKTTFAASKVQQIVVDGKGGNDKILLNSEACKGQRALQIAATIYGGTGDDTIVG